MAATPGGGAVVVGHSTHDERLTGAPYGQATSRPWIARVDGDGAVLDSWTGFVGRATAVAVDDAGRAYVTLTGLRDDEDWSREPQCELRALQADGTALWTQRWGEGVTQECPTEVALASDAVIVRVAERLEALDSDGSVRWQLDLPVDVRGPVPLSSYGDHVWLAYERFVDDQYVPQAWRIDARDGSATELDLEYDGLRLDEVHAVADGLLVMGSPRVGPNAFSTDDRLVSLTLDGKRRWMDDEPRPPAGSGSLPGWGILGKSVVADATTPWVIGTERLFEDPLGEASGGARFRVMIQRWTANGELQGTLRRSFIEAHHDRPTDATPSELSRAQCPFSDATEPPRFGSQPAAAVVLADGALLLAGEQGCRDSFLMRLDVQS